MEEKDRVALFLCNDSTSQCAQRSAEELVKGERTSLCKQAKEWQESNPRLKTKCITYGSNKVNLKLSTSKVFSSFKLLASETDTERQKKRQLQRRL